MEIMGNKKIDEYYKELAKTITDPKATRNKAKDSSKYDVELMKLLADENKILLDLGAGTGLLINHLVDDFKRIYAVEKFPEFSKFIQKTEKIIIENKDLLEWENKFNIKFDIISLFGVMNYFDEEEAILIYKKIFDNLNSNGILVVKNQMGVNKDIIINGFSKELQTNYYSEYRFVEKEINILKKIGFYDIEKKDIYPSEYNRWDNTHFYALICKK